MQLGPGTILHLPTITQCGICVNFGNAADGVGNRQLAINTAADVQTLCEAVLNTSLRPASFTDEMCFFWKKQNNQS